MLVFVFANLLLLHSARAGQSCLKQCAAGMLKCRHGGSVIPSQCEQYVSANDVSLMECDCPAEFEGINCQIPKSTAACPDGHYFDSDALTRRARQTFECQINQKQYPPSRKSWLPLWRKNATLADDVVRLAGHSVHITSDWSKKQIDISILSRVTRRFSSFYKKKLGPVDEIVRCSGKGCVLDGTTAQCQTFSCSTPNQQFPLFATALAAMNTATVRFQDQTVDVVGFLAFDSCKFGACAPLYPPGSGALAGSILAPSFASVLLLVLIAVVFVMHRDVLRPPSAILRKSRSHFGHGTTKRRETNFTVPIGMVWRDVSYTLPAYRSLLQSRRRPGETILKKAWGMVRPGEMVAIIGPSGAGKSTLLDFLGGIRRKGTLSGDITLTGAHSGSYPRSHLLSYVVQSDHFLGVMTVWETLYFSAVTRLPRILPESEILERVADILDLVGLVHVATSVVGTPETSGISGGERRRLAVGVEVIAEPRVMLLDEVTSGLDSFYASSILGVLRDIATKTGMAIVLTIHQPPASTFSLFDRIVLMASGGRTVFQGAPKDALDFVQSHRLMLSPCLDGCNPFEYLVSALGSSAIDEAADAYRISPAFIRMSNEIAALIAGSDDDSAGARDKYDTVHVGAQQRRNRLTFFQQTSVLTMRSFRVVTRDPSLLILYNFLTLALALFAGFTFMNLDLSVSGIQNRTGYVFCAILVGALLSMTSVDSFVIDRILFEKEIRAGCYSILPYFLAKLFVDLIPFRIIPALIFSCVSYYWIGFQRDFLHFAVFTAVLVLCNAVAGASIFAISTAFADVKSANLVGVTYFMFNIVFGGPLLSQAQKQSSSAVLSMLSFFYYAFETMVSNEMMGLPFFLKMSDLIQDDRYGSAGKDASGEEMLKAMSWSPQNRLMNVYVLGGMLAGFYVIVLIMLKITQRRTR